ncbi:hypothetical protein LCGC14_2082470 [marine sediment metagenome]|uniref:Uncharacterized protein n=1 Tax=marine sediment metagenome TaxID=412755 RepID=A0A0F9HC72_9ZZZZ
MRVERLWDAIEDAQIEAGDYRNTPADDRRIAIDTVASALSFYREQTLERWWPCWLFLTCPDRVIGLGWRGVLVIWRNP